MPSWVLTLGEAVISQVISATLAREHEICTMTPKMLQVALEFPEAREDEVPGMPWACAV